MQGGLRYSSMHINHALIMTAWRFIGQFCFPQVLTDNGQEKKRGFTRTSMEGGKMRSLFAPLQLIRINFEIYAQ